MKGRYSILARVLAAACAFSIVLGLMLPGFGTLSARAEPEHTLWLVGDSTVSSFSDAYYYPR